LLLDESLPRVLARDLPGHEVSTVQALGWSGTANGDLLSRAAESGFDVFLTPDKGLEFEQNPQTLPLTVVILRARSNRLEDLRPLIPEALERLRWAMPRQLIKVGDRAG
jgi:hypothetical protein